MNENLVELAIEANDETGNNFDLNYKPLEELLANFAALIVKECIFAVENHGGMCGAASSKKIKQHFGVEE